MVRERERERRGIEHACACAEIVDGFFCIAGLLEIGRGVVKGSNRLYGKNWQYLAYLALFYTLLAL